jgi:hypothetical protein
MLATKAGDIDLRIPKLRKGSFFPLILKPRRRIDQALYAVVLEAYVAGVSNPLERVNKEIKRRARVVDISQRTCGHPPRRRYPGRHARRVAVRRTPLPLRGLHGPTQPDQRY